MRRGFSLDVKQLREVEPGLSVHVKESVSSSMQLIQKGFHKLQALQPLTWIVALFLTMSLCFIALIPLPRADNHLIGSDGGYYYSYMRSFWVDHDVDITNDVVLYNSRMAADNPNHLRVLYDRSIGPSLLWSPFFLVARATTLLLHRSGLSIATDGYSYLEEASICISSILYVCLGMYLLFLTLSRYTDKQSSLAGILAMFALTFAIYYTVLEPSMGHAVELFSVSAFLWAILGRRTETLLAWAMVGLTAGIMVVVRWQNGVFLLLVLYGLFQGGCNVRKLVARGLATAGSMLPIIAIQSLFWYGSFDKAITIPQGNHFITPLAPHLYEVLFSTRHGLVSWHPVFAVAMVGMCFVRPIRIGILLSLLVLLQLYVCSIVTEWWCADSFGMRRMTGTIPMLSFGFAFLLSRSKRAETYKRWALYAAVLGLLVWNVFFMAQYRLGIIPSGDALSIREMTWGKLDVVAKGYGYLKRYTTSGSGTQSTDPNEK